MYHKQYQCIGKIGAVNSTNELGRQMSSDPPHGYFFPHCGRETSSLSSRTKLCSSQTSLSSPYIHTSIALYYIVALGLRTSRFPSTPTAIQSHVACLSPNYPLEISIINCAKCSLRKCHLIMTEHRTLLLTRKKPSLVLSSTQMPKLVAQDGYSHRP